MQVAEILAVKCSENKVTVLLTVGNESKRGKISRKLFDWNNTIWWICTDDFLLAVCAEHRGMWLGLHLIQNLSIPKEEHNTILNHILEDEILVIIAHNEDI